MKITFMLLLFSFFVVSCSSTSFNQIEKNKVDLEKITDRDFVRVRAIPYSASKDFYPVAINDSRATQTETMADRSKESLVDNSEDQDPLQRAANYCYGGHIDSGINLLDNFYKKYRKHPAYWNMLGNCFLKKASFRKAILYYNKALEFKKKYAPAINNLGVIYLYQKKYQKAQVAFQRAISFNKNMVTSKYNLAQLYLRYGLAKEATNLLIKVNKKKPGDVRILNALASSLLMADRYKASVLYYKMIPEDYLERAEISLNYSVALFLMGDSEAAHDVFDEIDTDDLDILRDYYHKVASTIGYKL